MSRPKWRAISVVAADKSKSGLVDDSSCIEVMFQNNESSALDRSSRLVVLFSSKAAQAGLRIAGTLLSALSPTGAGGNIDAQAVRNYDNLRQSHRIEPEGRRPTVSYDISRFLWGGLVQLTFRCRHCAQVRLPSAALVGKLPTCGSIRDRQPSSLTIGLELCRRCR